jgi:hypothetical protein
MNLAGIEHVKNPPFDHKDITTFMHQCMHTFPCLFRPNQCFKRDRSVTPLCILFC